MFIASYMKKWIFLVCTVLFVAALCFYLLIPSDLTVVRLVPASCQADVGFRMFAQQKNWDRWWPGDKDSFRYKGISYDLTKVSYQLINVRIRNDGTDYDSRLAAIPVGKQDSMYLQWECPLHGGVNPFKRLRQYVLAREIARNMGEILDSLSRFLGRKENIYGAAIRRGTLMDSTLVTTRPFLPDIRRRLIFTVF